MDGPAFYRAIQRDQPRLGTRIVFMTAHERLGEYARFVREMRAPVLRRPFYQEELIATLSRMIRPAHVGQLNG